LRDLIEARFARDRPGRRGRSEAARREAPAESLVLPMRQLELARQRLMERLPRLEPRRTLRQRAYGEPAIDAQKAAG
jgi:hypothetical protein